MLQQPIHTFCTQFGVKINAELQSVSFHKDWSPGCKNALKHLYRIISVTNFDV